MAYGTKYKVPFKSESGIDFEILIQEDLYTGAITELQSGANPFVIISDNASLYENVIGSGAEIQLISATPLQLLNLYTLENQKYKVKLMSGVNEVWDGWLNPETYEEVYSETYNYQVNFTANDGIALLSNIDFLDASGNRYTDIESIFDIISNILGKLNTDKNLNIITPTKIVDKSNTILTPSDTILHDIFISNQNFYDELDVPLNCRDVLENILKSNSLYLRTNSIGSEIGFTIFDLNVLDRENSITGKIYNGKTKAYVSSFSFDGLADKLDLQNNLEYFATGSAMSYENALNNQRITYSPYIIVDLIDIKIKEDNTGARTSYASHYLCGTAANGYWYEYSLGYPSTLEGVTFLDSSCEAVELCTGEVGDSATVENVDYYIKYPQDSPTSAYMFETDFSHDSIWGNYQSTNDFNNWALKLDFQIMLKNDTKCYVPDNINWVANFTITVTIYIGIYTIAKNIQIDSLETPGKIYESKWYHPIGADVDEGAIIKLDSAILNQNYDGQVKVKFSNGNNIGATLFDYIRIKDINVKLVRDLGTNFDEFDKKDVVIENTLNELARKNGKEIKLINGTRISTSGIERGALMYDSPLGYYALDKLDKELTGYQFISENWIANTIMSNYQNPAIKLENISIVASGLNSNVITCLTDVSQFATKKFMISGYNYSLYNDNLVLNLIEFSRDKMDVNG